MQSAIEHMEQELTQAFRDGQTTALYRVLDVLNSELNIHEQANFDADENDGVVDEDGQSGIAAENDFGVTDDYAAAVAAEQADYDASSGYAAAEADEGSFTSQNPFHQIKLIDTDGSVVATLNNYDSDGEVRTDLTHSDLQRMIAKAALLGFNAGQQSGRDEAADFFQTAFGFDPTDDFGLAEDVEPEEVAELIAD